jgi:hypothetical protein
MTQFDFGTIDPTVVDGTELGDDLNQWRDAIYSMHRAGTRPSYIVPGMMWIDDSGGASSWLLKVYFGATLGDTVFATYNSVTGKITIGTGEASSFSASKSADQRAGAGATVTVSFDAVKFNADGSYNASTNVWTPAVPGLYQVSYGMGIVADAGNVSVGGLIYRARDTATFFPNYQFMDVAGGGMTLVGSGPIRMAAADTLIVQFANDPGTGTSVKNAAWFGASWIAP